MHWVKLWEVANEGRCQTQDLSASWGAESFANWAYHSLVFLFIFLLVVCRHLLFFMRPTFSSISTTKPSNYPSKYGFATDNTTSIKHTPLFFSIGTKILKQNLTRKMPLYQIYHQNQYMKDPVNVSSCFRYYLITFWFKGPPSHQTLQFKSYF